MTIKKIKKFCKKHGISLSFLEKTLGFGNSTIAKWENSSPRVESLKKVADYFGCTVDELISDD